MSARLAPRRIRRAMTVRDLDNVTAIETSAYGFPWSRGNFVDSLAAGYLAEVLDEDGTGLIGYCIAMVGVDEMHLLNITVAPAWQGQGLGRMMLGALASHAREQGLASLWLEVRQGNQRARALYRQLGYAEVGLRRGYYPAAGRREDAVVMSLPLQAAPADEADA
jgi:[ribosomal protein S18]-alanine N-acetyltransferase